jgi:hypothetical protein
MLDMLRRAWQGSKQIAHKIGNFQARVLLTVFYGVLVLPFGLAARLFSDPLRIKKTPTEWADHPDDSYGMDWARKQ